MIYHSVGSLMSEIDLADEFPNIFKREVRRTYTVLSLKIEDEDWVDVRQCRDTPSGREARSKWIGTYTQAGFDVKSSTRDYKTDINEDAFQLLKIRKCSRQISKLIDKLKDTSNREEIHVTLNLAEDSLKNLDSAISTIINR